MPVPMAITGTVTLVNLLRISLVGQVLLMMTTDFPVASPDALDAEASTTTDSPRFWRRTFIAVSPAVKEVALATIRRAGAPTGAKGVGFCACRRLAPAVRSGAVPAGGATRAVQATAASKS